MFITWYNFGSMTITVTFADGDTRESNIAYGYKDAMDAIRLLHKTFGIVSAVLVDADTGEVIAEVSPD